jgi:hypothetical protein
MPVTIQGEVKVEENKQSKKAGEKRQNIDTFYSSTTGVFS